MKKLFTGIALMGMFTFALSQQISFDKTTWDYGTIKTGADGKRVFTVKNTGDKPLIISSVKPGCGCTVPSWSKDPILPGKTAEIQVGYNTNINGRFSKQIEVFSNDPANGRTTLTIAGNVDPNAPEPKPLTATEKKKLEIEAKQKEISTIESSIETEKAKEDADKAQVKTLKKNLKALNKDLKTLNAELKTLG